MRLKPQAVGQQEKVDVMKRAHLAASGYHEQISQVAINYLDWDQNVFIANSEGLMAEDRRTRTRIAINAVASKGNENNPVSEGRDATWALNCLTILM